ncbi:MULTISPECIES: leucyl aminopeptidase [Streptomyces]|uniref:Probable cytosol aminopeptidase n=5 Tax=Streptomyces TaxID=1883 RepID=AMPA_STRCO|nr:MULTISPECIES: leucyl aminopeptidase [Streptomyces]Q9S2Q7.1 RecName: Full=Probable cytosol aminopeptidase; AltName: Full=Leucine aminopeptidase; Short=LAP; AltName: Full=Leucyl aminopeptidase [Streptomyces coelicolor A3(2)]MYU41705.1 leucyl aminopeptidase [Streptomyces sp. SID7813]WOZ00985.1 leucyl aminopeptidase [Streptomyces violaceoruber]MCW8119786.1 leucyl aminopeptidase [Streptomyces anthocyanicus]MCZ4637961.1 leucyl aminopeptidase [Streptomyces rubrogriseus]MDX2926081.1 leucyl aminope
MTALTLSTAAAPGLRADAIVIGVAKGAGGPSVAPGAEAVDKAYDGRLAAVLETLGASGAEGEVTKLPAPSGFKAPVVVAVGLGAEPEKDAGFDPEALRRAAGAAARALAGAKKAAFALPLAEAADAGVVAEGLLLGAYSFDAYKASAKEAKEAKGAKAKANGNGKAPLAEAALLGGKPRDKAYKAAIERATAVAEELNRARDLVNTPPNDLDPEAFAAVAQAAAKEHGIKVQVLDEKALVKGGYGGILGVGAGSASGPRLVKLSYTSPKAKKSLAFVGKGITYDSGGISLKPAGHNETMKCDMAGAAAVFAAVVAAARLGLEVNVTGWLALAENMPSGSATRPGDVLRMYSGKTVEVLNTDAEGRLVLADALWAASQDEPDAIIDVATLTGAMMLALGSRTYGIMANDDAFRSAVHEAAEESGEPAWPMPLPEHLRKGMDSPTADIANMGERMGGGLVAGLFLREFVGEGITWAHLDIAGPAFNEGGPFGYTPKGGTGTAVRTLVRVAELAAAGELG